MRRRRGRATSCELRAASWGSKPGTAFVALALLFLFFGRTHAAEVSADQLDPAAISAFAKELASLPRREQGRPGAAFALALIEARLIEVGLAPLRVRTTVSVAMDRGSVLTVGGQEIRLTPHQSNHAATAGSGGQEIRGPLMFAGMGSLKELSRTSVIGSIVVLDGASRDGWTNAAGLGAAAVVFSGTAHMDRWPMSGQALSASISFPRFVADLDPALDGQPAVLRSTVVWEPRPAWSLMAVIPGRARSHEAVLLTSGYESNGAIDGLNPGATRAWGAAALTELACSLARHPSERTAVVVFNGGRAEMFRGLRQLTAALTSDRDRDGLLDQQQNKVLTLYGEAEAAVQRATLVANVLDRTTVDNASSKAGLRASITAAVGGLDAEAMAHLGPDGALHTARLLDQVLASEAGDQADPRLEQLEPLRARLARRVQLGLSADDIAALTARIASAEPDYTAWRTLQQKLDYGKDLTPDEDRLLAQILPTARTLLDHHRQVLAQRSGDFASLASARAALGRINPIHLLALDLSDGNAAFSSVTSGFYVTWSNELGWLHRALVRLAEQTPGSAYDPAPHQLIGEAGAWWPEFHQHEAGVVGLYLPAVTLATTNDARLKLGTPRDTMANFRSADFLRQCAGLLPLVRAFIDCPEIADRRAKNLNFQDRWIRAETRTVGAKDGRRPAPFPFNVVMMGGRSDFTGDVRQWETWWGDLAGEAQVPFLPDSAPNFGGRGLPVSIYGHDNAGMITHVLASGGMQRASSDLQFTVQWQVRDLLALVFRAEGGRMFNVHDPRLVASLPPVTPLSATRNAEPNFSHVEAVDGQNAIFTEPGTALLVTAAQARTGNRMVLLGADSGQSGNFAGHLSASFPQPTALAAAEDLWRLDDRRLALLRRNGIGADSLVTMHAAAERSLEQARAALASGDLAAATGAAQSSWAYSTRVYPSLLSTANDVVQGLVVLLAFAIPFALICERLFLASATIGRRVAGFAGFFAATFLAFYAFHPAFALATTPAIIFLAFVIIALSGWVIALVYARFEHEMDSLRRSSLGEHRADLSRLGTLVATVALGISNMRRRPLRTALTATTVTLMAFILLTFSGFTPSLATQRIELDSAPGWRGILLRQNGWTALSERALERSRNRWSNDFTIHPLRWLQPTPAMPKLPIDGPHGASSVSGAIGIAVGDPTGIERALVRGGLTPGAGAGSPRGLGDGSDGEWLFLPPEALRRLGTTPGGPVRLRGREFRAGTIDVRVLAGLTHLGGEVPTPLALDVLDPKQQAAIGRQSALSPDGPASTETAAFTHLAAGSVAVLRESELATLGWSNTLRGVSLSPRTSAVDVAATAEDMAQQLALTLRVGDAGRTYLLTGTGGLEAVGLAGVLVPLVLGGLIIFSTMLNSVAERGREIFIFASLGLAPIHVAALFLVEAGIYAVLGGLGGYLLAQAVAWALGIAAAFGLGVQPDLNYSSFTAVTTILMVMGTVLLSAIHPALVASRAANPGTTDFRVPVPVGDHMDVDFPFTIAARDVRGLLAFMVHHLEVRAEGSTSGYTAGDVLLHADDDGGYDQRFAVSARIWLAPFDLGLSQKFSLETSPTDMPAIHAVRIRLDLLSGQRSSWRRANAAFLKDLRLQFLVWRTLTPETMDRYRARGGDVAAQTRVDALDAANVLAEDAP